MAADRYQWLLHNSPLLLLVLDELLVCQCLSDAWRDRLAADVAASEPLTVAALFDLTDDPELLQGLAAVARDGIPLLNAAVSLRLADGLLPCRLSAWRVTCEQDAECDIIVTATDVSDYQDVISQLAQLQSQHRLILDAAGEGIYGLDSEGCVTFGNAAAADIVGWKNENILGQKSHDVHHHSRSDGSSYAHEDCPIYAALKDGEVHTVDDEVFWHANGTAVPVEYTSTPILKDGKPDGAVVIFRDVSQRKELERQRAEAFDEIKALKEQLEQERDYLRDEINLTLHFGEIIGESSSLRRTLAQIEAVAATPANVLILGESGVGKEMIARAIHFQSNRSEKPLVKVNCASIPKDLFESEFFGHVKGSFTGAHRDRTGRPQLAHGGTLFLDEVGEIPLSLQGKLLRALQEREFERVGDDRTVKVDVRVVAATNRNLADDVKTGHFREDLFYRLSVFPIEVPPLRERIDDIAPLAAHFLETICKEFGRERLQMTQQQVATLRAQRWPGNIRELRNVIERAVISSSGSRLRLDLALPDSADPIAISSDINNINDVSESGFLTEAEFRASEKANLIAALQHAKWQVWGEHGAAALLGIKPSTLAYRMKNFGITKPVEPTITTDL